MPRGPYIRKGDSRIVLTPLKLQALTLRTLDKLDYKEIAKRQNTSREAVFQRVQSAMSIIQIACEKELRLCHK